MVSLLFYISYSTNLVFFITSIVLCSLFFSKYIKYKKQELLYFGLSVLTAGITLTGFTSFWDTIKIFTSYEVPFIIYFFSFGLYPLAAAFYIKSISTLIIKDTKRQKILVGITTLLSLALIVVYYTLFFLDTAIVGYIDEDGLFNGNFFTIIIYTPTSSLIVLIGALVFVYKALKTEDEVTQLKGKFILLATILLIISALTGFLEVLGIPLEGTLFINTITRVLGFIFLYIGFALPESAKKIFLK